jgi:hypothetical protein
MKELRCASWKHPHDYIQVELHGLEWTNDQLAAVMDQWHWAGDVDDLRGGFEYRLKVPLDVHVLQSTPRGGDTIYVLWPKGEPEPD